MYPHRIRLRGPWEYESLDRAEHALHRSGRIVLPYAAGDASLRGLSGRVRFRRRFGYPGRIDAHERVWLVLEGVPGPIEAAVNGAVAGSGVGAIECEVTQRLGPRNELTVDVLDFASDNGLWTEAALEVRCTAYLRGVKVMRTADRIHATGEVVGQAEGPLELYLIADRSPAAYATVDPVGGIQRFDLYAEARHADGAAIERVQIDLVQCASVWYTVETAVLAEAAEEPGA